jgi:pimeloyl-ACP methyl ester carboxylesterase
LPHEAPRCSSGYTDSRDHRTVILEGAGHYIQEDGPEEIIGAIGEWRRREQ